MPFAAIRLVASDLDGTLLRADRVITPRTRAALRAWEAVGALVAVTGRPPRTALPAAAELGLGGLLICCNGALTLDLASGTIARHRPITPAVAQTIVRRLRAAAPGVAFGVERELLQECEPEYLRQRPFSATSSPRLGDALDLCARPITKLLAVHPTLPTADLVTLASVAAGATAEVSHSGLPLAEICAAGVDKASAVADLCRARGIGPDAVAAFGDMPNDLPLLRWAGLSIAVANAHPDVLAAADLVTAANDDDGVARIIERLIAARAAGLPPS